ncbi:complement regulator-acquiring protein (plasmid) [Borrelia coriaceae]|nr:complement regulator-acquiring protein [Borrelia coriaceae]UPA17112.1 complement regulator-acquiring protein [Borrelia coriaceae]UPA17223.1 complement regulator-acquiring protein [Borrelia coriaceae]
MRKKLFIFILLIIGLVSCDVNSKLLDKGETRDAVGAVDNGVQGDERIKNIISNGDFSEEVNKAPVEEVVEAGPVIKDEKEELIAAIKKDVNIGMGLINSDKKEVEDESQYGMKEVVFKAVTDGVTNKALDDDLNKDLRRLFYSSLLYDKERIKEFAEILNKIGTDGQNKGTWLIDIMDSGIVYLQFNFERVISKLDKNKDKLDQLSLDDLREIKSKLEEIQLQRLTWKKSVDAIIVAYKAKKEGIDSDSKRLISYISERYKNLITVEIPGIQGVSDKIISLIDKIK